MESNRVEFNPRSVSYLYTKEPQRSLQSILPLIGYLSIDRELRSAVLNSQRDVITGWIVMVKYLPWSGRMATGLKFLL